VPSLPRFLVSPQRRAAARSARRGVVLLAGALAVLAVVGLVVFPPGIGTRATLTGASLVLLVLSALLALRIWRVAVVADRWVGSGGRVLEFTDDGLIAAGDVWVPWDSVSGVWAQDRGAALRARADRRVIGGPGRVLLRAGVSTGELTIGVTDVATITDPARRVRRFARLPGGQTPGRIEIPLGAWFGTDELAAAVSAARAVLPAEVPARLTDGVTDYAAAWAGTADDVATIRRREASRAA
jgi:hypothetical protein